MNRISAIKCVHRCFASATSLTSTGIEHAEALAKVGGRKPDWNLYKVPEYLKTDTYTFYDAEIEIAKNRLPQPTNKKPDVLPKVKSDQKSQKSQQ